mmetsp:Transcript_47851/g.57925  ORF Transcript_47851/g.57925 Transcript_47851/m.57925 type:complete len:331 (+) Transcript_47851:91-1083(+)
MAIISSFVRAKRAKAFFVKTASVLSILALLIVYLIDGDIRRLQIHSIEQINVENHAVGILLRNDEDIEDLKYNLRALRKYEIVRKETPICIFHEDTFPVEKKWDIMRMTLNPISFHVVNFEVPEGLVSAEDIDEERLKQHFWISGAWEHPAVGQFETIMRLDADSCFVSVGVDVEDIHLPSMRGRYVYRSNGPNTGDSAWIDGLYDFTVNYMEANEITPSHPELWETVQQMWINEGTLPVFDTSFEVHRVPFFKRRDVMRWHKNITESEPYGILRRHWGEAQIRVLTMALFGTNDSDNHNVLMKDHPGYRHGKEICVEHFQFVDTSSRSA